MAVTARIGVGGAMGGLTAMAVLSTQMDPPTLVYSSMGANTVSVSLFLPKVISTVGTG